MSQCLVCRHESWAARWPGLMRCADCGFLTADLSQPFDPAELYDEAYFHGGEYQNYWADRASIQRNFRDRLADVVRFESGGRLLEIGSAHGFFLDLARPSFQGVGFEISAAAAAAAQGLGLDVRCQEFLEADLEAEPPFDVAVLWDVIEHLVHPDAVLAKASARLKRGGHVLLTTGDLGSLNARIRGRRWRLIHPPSHLHYFDVKTISRLLDACGVDVVEVKHVGYHRTWKQMLNFILTNRAGLPGLYRSVSRWLDEDSGIYLNLFDIMLVVGRKR